MTTTDFQDSPDDPFDPSKFIDFSSSSPDTLQRLDASRKSGAQPFPAGTQLGFSASAHGEYHEYSDDSAGSSKQSLKKNEPVHNPQLLPDVKMEGDFGSGTMNYDDIFDQDAPFMPEPEAGPSMQDGFFDDPSFMSRQQMDFDQDMTSKATSTVSGLQSPAMPTISPNDDLGQSHNRQDSVSLGASFQSVLSSLLTTPAALLHRFFSKWMAGCVTRGVPHV